MKQKYQLFIGLILLSSLFLTACPPGGKTDCASYEACIKECEKHYTSCMKTANDGLDAAEKAYKDAIKECDRIYFSDIKNCTDPKTKAACIARCDNARAACELKADQAMKQQRDIYNTKTEACRKDREACEKACRQEHKECAGDEPR